MKTVIKLIRYTLAAFFLAASGCWLALWWRNAALGDVVYAATVYAGSMSLSAEVFDGTVVAASVPRRATDDCWFVDSFRLGEDGRVDFQQNIVGHQGQFGSFPKGYFFPLWYASLVFALTGVGVIRFRRQYSVRSAMIATTIVAALIGMVAAF